MLTGVPLLDRQGRRARPAAAYRMARRLNSLGLLGDDRMEAMRKRYGSADYRAAHGVMRDVLVRLLAEQYGDAMSAVSCPVDLVWGERGHRGAARGGRPGHVGVPRRQTVTLPGVGHLLPTEAPGPLRQAVLGRDARPLATPEPAAGDDPMAGSR